MISTPPKVYPSVDWFSCTTGNCPDADLAWDRARALAAEQASAGDTLRPWGANGYRGWGTPHLRFGQRDGDVLLELSGGLAEKYWQQFYPLAKNVTRLDTCVTVTFPRETRGLAEDAEAAPRVRPSPNFPAIRKVLWRDQDAGQTLYLGSPKSARFGRLYDKSAESRGEWPANTWRWEVQERRHMGSTRAGILDAADDVHRAIRAFVHGYWSYHGIHPWFHADGPSLLAAPGRPRTDMQRRITYYERSIQPGVRSGINRGYGYALLAAIGIDDDELLAQLGLAVIPGGHFAAGRQHNTKERTACPSTPPLEDLTPPLPWPTPMPRSIPPESTRWPRSSADGADASSSGNRTDLT